MRHEKNLRSAESRARDRKSEIERLRNDECALDRLLEDHQLLVEAIQTNPMPYCVYDAEDRLLVANAAYGALHPALADLLATAGENPVFYRDVVRHQLQEQFSGDELDEQVEMRVAAQRNLDGKQVERDYPGVGVFNVLKYSLISGGTAGIAFDVTDLKEREGQLEAASRNASIALEKEQARKQHGKHLSELGEWLQSCKSLEELFRVVRRFMARLFPGSAGELYIYSNSRDVLDGACEWNRASELHAHIQPDDCWALRRGRMLRYGSGLADLTCNHVNADGEQDMDDISYSCIPIIAHGDTVGLLHIRFADHSGQMLEEDEQTSFAIQCAEQISLAVANVRLRDELEEQSTRDPLTGLFNRRHFMNRFRNDLMETQKQGAPFSLISIDADHFKKMNDIHGHDAGDVVLRTLAEGLLEGIEDRDTLARVGGEEFAIILPNKGLEEARSMAETLRRNIEQLEMTYEGAPLPAVTISCGVATAERCSTIQSLLRLADAALYNAKDNGRNRVHPPTNPVEC